MYRVAILTVAVGVLLAGCGASQGPAAGFSATGDPQFDALWDAATAALRDYRFHIDRQDRRAGVVTTFPLVGRHWFECWRKDAATPRDVLEGTLHTVTRTATVTIRKAPAGQGAVGKYAVAVEVRTRRSTLPTYQVTSTADAYDLFLGRGDVARTCAADVTRRQGRGAGKEEDLGRDAALEKVIRRRIVSLAQKALATPAATPGPTTTTKPTP